MKRFFVLGASALALTIGLAAVPAFAADEAQEAAAEAGEAGEQSAETADTSAEGEMADPDVASGPASE